MPRYKDFQNFYIWTNVNGSERGAADIEALASKYPGTTMQPSLDLVRCFHLDPATDRWWIGYTQRNRSAADVLRVFEGWLKRHAEGGPGAPAGGDGDGG